MATELVSGLIEPDVNDEMVKFTEGIATSMRTLDAWFPVGSIREFTTSVDPNTFMPGTWSELTGVFLFARDSDFPAGTSGGEKAHALTGAENGPHNHQIPVNNGGAGPYSGSGTTYTGSLSGVGAIDTQNKGSGTPHNNMPPFRSVYIWERTA